MDNNVNVTNFFNPPAALTQAKINEGKAKTELPIWKVLLLGIFAGMFIAIGASSSSLAVHAMANPGLAKLVAGLIFPVGLMMIVFIGGELFTGDCMMIIGVMDKKYSVLQMIKVLVLVWLSNFVGSMIIVGLVYGCGQYDMSSGVLGAYTIKVALGKATLTWGKAIASGIMCNILVCIAVLMGGAARDVGGKIFAILFPIMAFVVGGYEHCVANMYYIPAGMVAATNPAYKQAAMETYGFTAEQLANLDITHLVVNNLIPVTIGNMIGGMVFIGAALYVLHKNSLQK